MLKLVASWGVNPIDKLSEVFFMFINLNSFKFLSTFFIILINIFASAAFSSELKVMSLNIWRHDDYDRIFSIASNLNKDRMDIIILQEAVSYKADSNLKSTASNLADLINFNHEFRMRPNDIEGLAILSPWPIVKTQVFNLSQSSMEPYHRILLVSTIVHPQIGEIRVYNLHLAYMEEDYQGRIAQIENVFQIMKNIEDRDPAETVILGGDFNSKFGSVEMDRVYDLWTSYFALINFTNPNSDFPTWADVKVTNTFESGRRLDYLFLQSVKKNNFLGERFLFSEQKATSERVFRQYGLEQIWVSDHRAVVHEYKF